MRVNPLFPSGKDVSMMLSPRHDIQTNFFLTLDRRLSDTRRSLPPSSSLPRARAHAGARQRSRNWLLRHEPRGGSSAMRRRNLVGSRYRCTACRPRRPLLPKYRNERERSVSTMILHERHANVRGCIGRRGGRSMRSTRPTLL